MSLEVVHARGLVPLETDLLVVLGKNLGVGSSRQDIRESPDYLSIDSRISTLAAAELYGYIPGMRILLSGGRTIGEDFPSQPSAARDFLHAVYPDIRLEDVLLDEDGPNTAASAESVAKIAQTQEINFQHLGLLSVGYHVKNAAVLFERRDAPVETVIASEGILAERSQEDRARMIARGGLRRIKAERLKEMARTVALHTVDKDGEGLARFTAGRLDQ